MYRSNIAAILALFLSTCCAACSRTNEDKPAGAMAASTRQSEDHASPGAKTEQGASTEEPSIDLNSESSGETDLTEPSAPLVTPTDPSLHPELVEILKGYSDPSSEREAYRKAEDFVKAHDENALGHYLYAHGCAMDGKTDDAVQHFRRALACVLPPRQHNLASQVVNATAAKPSETTPAFVHVYKAFGEVQLDISRLADEVSGRRPKAKQAILDSTPEIQAFVSALKVGGPMRVIDEALTGTQHSVSWADGKIGKAPRDWVYDELKKVRVKEWEVFLGTATSEELYLWLEPTAAKVYPLSLDLFRELSVPRMHKWVLHDEAPDAFLLVWTEQEVGGSPTTLGGSPTPRETLRIPMLFRWDGNKVTASADAPIPDMIRRLEAENKGE